MSDDLIWRLLAGFLAGWCMAESFRAMRDRRRTELLWMFASAALLVAAYR